MKFTTAALGFLFTQLLVASTQARLLVDYRGGQPANQLGNVELEGNALGCAITNGKAGDAAFVRPGRDPVTNREALHFHRDPFFRRAEVKVGGKTGPGKTYYIGYEFRLRTKGESLVVFQWKKKDKVVAPKQNIPIYVFFDGRGDLIIEYTTPGGSGSDREIVWRGPLDTSKPTKLAFVINTADDEKSPRFKYKGSLRAFVNGKEVTLSQKRGPKRKRQNSNQKGLQGVAMWTGETNPKFGIYRAEAKNNGNQYCPKNRVFTGPKAPNNADRSYDSWVYRVQISDSSLDEIAESSGIGK